MSETIFWLIIVIVAVIIDAITSAFLFVWFAAGAFAAMIASLFGVAGWIQLIVFLIVSIIATAIGYPWAKRKLKKTVKRTPLMEENYIGMTIKADRVIEKTGRIKIGGSYWGVINKGQTIEKGSKFRIVGIEGNKLIIKKEEEK